MDCIFCKIIKGEVPSSLLYEDEYMIIIKDISPQADKHYLLIPKRHYQSIVHMSGYDAFVLAKCLRKLGELTEELGLGGGFRIASNVGENGCQSVPHLHFHILGGEKLSEKMG